MTSTYLFNGHRRLDYFWENPNHAGACLASLACVLWIADGTKWRHKVFVIECLLFIALAKTYSRGALIALLTALLYGIICSASRDGPGLGLRIWRARIVALLACVVATGFYSRVNPLFLVNDGSVTNRLNLWGGSASMITLAPLSGWGAGESGRAYMNWFQDVERSEQYTTTVNSYLHIGVERGIVPLAGILFCTVALLHMGWRRSNGHDMRVAAAGGVICSWAIANVFSTLWMDLTLWVVPLLAACMVIYLFFKNTRDKTNEVLFVSCSAASLMTASIVLFGWSMLRADDARLRHVNRREIEITNQLKGTPQFYRIWVDQEILGNTPGKEIRRLMKESDGIVMRVHWATKFRQCESEEPYTLVLMGRHVEALKNEFTALCRRLWIIHPIGSPPEHMMGFPSSIVLLLPAIDQTGNTPAWRQWGKRNGVCVLDSSEVGLDIRFCWPSAFLRIQELKNNL